MRRFAQKDERKIPGEEPSWEAEQKREYEKKIKEILKSENDVIKFCGDLKAAGSGLKQAATKIPQPYFLISLSLSSIGDKFIEIGEGVVTAINLKKGAGLGLDIAGFVAPLYAPTSETPGLKRYIPFIGDYVNYRYTKTLTYQKDLIDPIERIFAPFKCDKSHPATTAPLMRGIVPNFLDHPELDEQYRAKTKSVADLATNLGAQLQNLEALAAWVATAFGQIEAATAIRLVGGFIQACILLLHIAFSPNTADLKEYSSAGFEGGGIDPKNPFASLNKIPGISKYIKQYEAKPIAEEAKAASEKTLQHFTLLELVPPNVVKLKDKFGEEKILITGEKWPKWNITITYVGPDHAEYKDKNGNKYSVRKAGPSFSNKEIFDQVMKDAANLSTSGVKGDVNKLMSKKMSFIISLVYQLKNKYPWIGDTRNSLWVNLQSDILTHNTTPIRRTTVKPVKPTRPTVTRPYRSPVNPNQTPVRTDTDTRLPGMSDLDF